MTRRIRGSERVIAIDLLRDDVDKCLKKMFNGEIPKQINRTH